MSLHHTSRVLTITQPGQLRALSHPVRAKILEILSQEAASAKMLSARLGMTHGKVGHHLGVLAKAGLVEVTKERPVRAVVERFFQTTYDRIQIDVGAGQDPLRFMLRQAAIEARPFEDQPIQPLGRIYSVRMGAARAEEFAARLIALADEFAESDEGVGSTFGFVGAVYEMDL